MELDCVEMYLRMKQLEPLRLEDQLSPKLCDTLCPSGLSGSTHAQGCKVHFGKYLLKQNRTTF